MKKMKWITGLLAAILLLPSCNGPAAGDDPVKILYVKDYGAVGDGVTDDTEAIRKAIAAAKRTHASVLQFEPKTYHLGETKDSWFHFDLQNFRNLTIDGNGAKLICDPINQIMSIKWSKNVTVKNFDIDYSPLPFTQGHVVAIDFAGGTYDFKVDEGYPKNLHDYWNNRAERFQGWSHSLIFKPDFSELNLDMAMDHLYIADSKQLSEDTYRFTVHKSHLHAMPGMNVGDGVVVGLGYMTDGRTWKDLEAVRPFTPGRYSAFYVNDSNNITLDHVSLRCCPGRWIRITDNIGPVNITHCNFEPPAGSGRVVTTIYDGVHAVNNKKELNITDNRFVGSMDDLVACVTKEEIVREVSKDGVVKLCNGDNSNTLYNLDVGNELLFVKKYEGKFLGSAVITEIVKTEGRLNWVKLDREVPGLVGVDRGSEPETVVGINYGRSSSGFKICNNYFNPVVRRALAITWADGQVIGNELDCHGGGSIWLMNVPTSFTGSFPKNIVVRDNVIRNSTHTSLMIGASWTRTINPERFDANLLIENNTIINQKGRQPAIQVAHMKNVQLRGNSITMEYPDQEKIKLINSELLPE